ALSPRQHAPGDGAGRARLPPRRQPPPEQRQPQPAHRRRSSRAPQGHRQLPLLPRPRPHRVPLSSLRLSCEAQTERSRSAVPSRIMRRLVFVVLAFSIGCDGPSAQGDAGGPDAAGSACTFDPGPAEEIPEPEAYTPRWAFEPWISKDISDREDSYAFVRGFLERDIPTGVLVIDSPWDSQYTTFTPNPSRYPDFAGMVSDMNAMGVRVVMWTTQMVNRSSFDLEAGGDIYRGRSPNFDEGCACGFLVNDCKLYRWWKGQGA